MKKAKSILALLLALLVAMGGTVCAFAAEAAEEAEANGTAAQANAFDFDTAINGVIGSADDVDYFTFTTEANGLVTVALDHAVVTGADSTYFAVTVEDADNNAITSFNSKGSEAGASRSFSAAPGKYYVKVVSGMITDTTLGYTVSVKNNISAFIEKEPNDVFDNATEMQLSASGNNKLYYGTMSKNDVDYYSVNFGGPSAVSFGIYNTAEETGNYVATLIKVVDGANGASEEKAIASITIGKNTVQANSSNVYVNGGKYYLKVEGVDSAVGGYQVRVFNIGSISDAEFEYNNEFKYSNLVSIGKAVRASLFDASDVDCYRFTTGANNGYEITVASYADAKKNVAGQWKIEMQNQSGNIVEVEVDDSDKTKLVVKTDKLDAGTYYLAVKADTAFSNEVYTLTVSAKAVEGDGDDDLNFFEKIQAIDWSTLLENFTSWLPSVDVMGIVRDLYQSIAKFVTEFLFANT